MIFGDSVALIVSVKFEGMVLAVSLDPTVGMVAVGDVVTFKLGIVVSAKIYNKLGSLYQ